jgi:hypothetical protein
MGSTSRWIEIGGVSSCSDCRKAACPMPKPGSAPGLESLARQVVFAVGQIVYSGSEVVLAAKAWGDWASLEQEAREGIACGW